MAITFNDQQKKSVLYALLAVIAVYADFTFLMSRQWGSYKRINTNLRQLKLSLSQYDKNSPYYKNLVSEYGQIKDKSADMEKNVYSEATLPLFLDDLSKLAHSFEVKIMQVNPQITASDKAKGSVKAQSSNFYPLFFDIDLNCSYHQLGRFLNALERNPLIEVSKIRVSSEGQGSRGQKASLTIKANVQKK